MSKDKYQYIICVLSGLLFFALILTPVCFYQYNTCKDNAEYVVKAQANSILSYGWDSIDSNNYTRYEKLKNKSRKWLLGGMFSLTTVVGSGVGICCLTKEYKKKLE